MKRGLGTSRPKANLGEAHAAGTEAEVSLWWCPNVNPNKPRPGGLEPNVEGGRIWKPGGLTILWSSDIYSGGTSTSAIEQKDVLWRSELHQGNIVLVRTRDRAALSVGTSLNFDANIHNEQELAEMLLMCLTYDFQKGFEVPPDAITVSSYK